MPSFNYKQAKQAGYSDDEIAKYLQEQNDQGADLYIDKNEYESATEVTQPKEQGLLEKTANVADKTFGKAADFLVGPVVKQVGNTGIRVGEAIAARTEPAKQLEKSNAGLQDTDMKAIQRARELAAEGKTDLAQRLLKVVQSHGSPITIEEILSEPSKNSIKQVAGEALSSAATAASFASGGGSFKLASKAGGKNLVEKTAARALKGTASGVTKKRLAAEGGAYGAAFAAGDKMQEEDSTFGDVAGSAVLGGGAGSALALGIGALVPYTVGTAINFGKSVKAAINPDAEAALIRAIKPSVKKTEFAKTLQTAIPDIYETAQLSGRDLSKSKDPIGDLDKTILEAKKRVWATYADLKDPNAAVEIDGNPIADMILGSMDKRFKTQNPSKAARIEEIANSYRRNISIDEAEEALQSANNDLHSYYAKNKVSRKVAEMDPDTGYVVREADGLRSQLYNKLADITGTDAAALKRRYGALSSVQEDVQRRANTTARESGTNLAEQVTFASGVGDVISSIGNGRFTDAAKGVGKIVTAKALRDANKPENLIRKAFTKMGEKPPELYAKPPNQFNRAITKAGQKSEVPALPAPKRSDLIKHKVSEMKKPIALPAMSETARQEAIKSSGIIKGGKPAIGTAEQVPARELLSIRTNAGQRALPPPRMIMPEKSPTTRSLDIARSSVTGAEPKKFSYKDKKTGKFARGYSTEVNVPKDVKKAESRVGTIGNGNSNEVYNIDEGNWNVQDGKKLKSLKKSHIKVGKEIQDDNRDHWIVKEVLDDNNFTAVMKGKKDMKPVQFKFPNKTKKRRSL